MANPVAVPKRLIPGAFLTCASVDRECRKCILKQCHLQSLPIGGKVAGRIRRVVRTAYYVVERLWVNKTRTGRIVFIVT
jgi:hypothetical protein